MILATPQLPLEPLAYVRPRCFMCVTYLAAGALDENHVLALPQ
jgi:hypothetical protein